MSRTLVRWSSVRFGSAVTWAAMRATSSARSFSRESNRWCSTWCCSFILFSVFLLPHGAGLQNRVQQCFATCHHVAVVDGGQAVFACFRLSSQYEVVGNERISSERVAPTLVPGWLRLAGNNRDVVEGAKILDGADEDLGPRFGISSLSKD